MKKSIKTIAFALLTVGMLAGCNKNSAPAAQGDWSDEAKADMTILMGEVLPYVQLEEETFYFEYQYQAGQALFTIGDESATNLVANYGDKLEDAGFRTTLYQGQPVYEKTNAAGYNIMLAFGWYEATAEYAQGNEIRALATLPEFKKWPADLVNFVFEINEAEAYDIPAFDAANASFVVDTYLYYGIFPYGVEVDIYGATEAEIGAYPYKLRNAGWTYDEASGTATKEFPELDGIATIGLIRGQTQAGEDVFSVIGLFSLSAIPTETWPAEKIAAAFEKLGLPEFEIPAPQGEGYTYEYRFDKSNIGYADEKEPSSCYDAMYINNMSADQFAAYGEQLNAAGWEGTATARGSYFKKHNDTLKATAQIYLAWTSSATYGEYATLRIYYVMSPDPSPDWPAADISAAFADLGLPEFEIPAPEGEGVGFKYDYDPSNKQDLNDPASCYDRVRVYGLDAEGLLAYVDKLEAADWVVVDEWLGDYTLQKHFDELNATATIMVEDYIAYSAACVYVRIYYIMDPDPSPVWPAEQIAEMLGEDVTDVLPAYVGENVTFKAYNDGYGMGVTVFVGEGNEEAAMEAYATTLTTAGFVPANDGTFKSKNGQFTVELYKGIDGAFNIELALVRHLSNEINDFLDMMESDVVCPDLSQFDDDVDWDYTGIDYDGGYYFVTWIDGDICEALTTILVTAGFQDPGEEDPDYGYLCYSADDSVLFQYMYVEYYLQTAIYVMVLG